MFFVPISIPKSIMRQNGLKTLLLVFRIRLLVHRLLLVFRIRLVHRHFREICLLSARDIFALIEKPLNEVDHHRVCPCGMQSHDCSASVFTLLPLSALELPTRQPRRLLDCQCQAYSSTMPQNISKALLQASGKFSLVKSSTEKPPSRH